LAVATALNCRSTSEEIVTVCRNMTWPTSTVTFGAALTAAARAAAPDEKPCPPSSAIGIELKMREMQRFSLGRRDCCDCCRDIAWNADIVAVQMHRMRDFEIRYRSLQSLDDFA